MFALFDSDVFFLSFGSGFYFAETAIQALLCGGEKTLECLTPRGRVFCLARPSVFYWKLRPVVLPPLFALFLQWVDVEIDLNSVGAWLLHQLMNGRFEYGPDFGWRGVLFELENNFSYAHRLNTSYWRLVWTQ